MPTTIPQTVLQLATMHALKGFQPTLSSTHRKFYAMGLHHGRGTLIVGGAEAALSLLCGRWDQLGPAPLGFRDPESAIIYTSRHHQNCNIKIAW